MDSTNARIINCYQDEFQHWDISNIDDLIEEDVIPEEEVVQQQQEIYQECEVTEEIITDDWVQGEENIIQVTVGDIGGVEVKQEDEIIPLTEEHNEFTLKPYPCDFCHKRFRKKANLHNHMIAHQNDHPYGCKLCGNRYTRKNELHKHLKIHAYNDDGYDDGFSPQIHHMKPVLDISNILSSPSTSKKPQKKAIIQQRIESLDPRKPYVCQICGVTFARPKALDAHMLLHGDMTLDECEKCGEQFWDASAMRKHRRRHIMKEQAKTEQEFDDEATESDIEARGMKDPIYGCTECPRSFNSTTALQHHIQTHLDPMEAEEEPLHCCNVCGEGFDEALDLLAHAEVHARNSAHRCLMCGDSFDQESTLKLHINESHRHELTDTTCRICGRLCKDARSLIRHSWDHSKERSHSCSRCAKTFQNKARLKRHMLSHKNKSVVCDVCHLHFPDGRSLMNHRHSHTKAHQFHCNVCGKSFGSRSSQQIHLRIHTGEKPYSCRFCWKAFADGGTLRKHERIHTGEKPYACAVCPRAFNQRVVLREHIRSHHSAPDIKNGSIYEPYYCTVCGNTFDSSANLVNHLVEHSDHNTQARRQPVVGPRKYKRRRARPEDDTKTTSRKEIEEEIATYNFRKSVPARVKREDFELPHELQPDIGQLTLKHIKEPKVEDIAIKSENFPLLDDGQPLETKMSADFFNESIMKFDPGVVNDLKEILQSPVKERERNDGRPRRSVKPTLKCIESQQQEKDFHKKTNRSTENRCQICGLAFSTRAGLVSHVQVHI